MTNDLETLREDLIAYAGTLDKNSPLHEVALRTAFELGRENPFGRNPNNWRAEDTTKFISRAKPVIDNEGIIYPSITVAANKLRVDARSLAVNLNEARCPFARYYV